MEKLQRRATIGSLLFCYEAWVLINLYELAPFLDAFQTSFS